MFALYVIRICTLIWILVQAYLVCWYHQNKYQQCSRDKLLSIMYNRLVYKYEKTTTTTTFLLVLVADLSLPANFHRYMIYPRHWNSIRQSSAIQIADFSFIRSFVSIFVHSSRQSHRFVIVPCQTGRDPTSASVPVDSAYCLRLHSWSIRARYGVPPFHPGPYSNSEPF